MNTINTLTTQEFLEYNSLPLKEDRGAGYVIKHSLIQAMNKERMDYNKKYNIRGLKSCFAKFTTFDNKLNQCVQHIFAFDGFNGIEIIRRFETYPTIWRRAYYSNGYMRSGLHPIFTKCYSYCVFAINDKDSWEIMPEKVESKLKYDYFEYNNFENIAIFDERIKYGSFDNNSNIDMLNYVKLYRDYPIAEIPMKLKLYKLCMNKSALVKLTNNKSFRKWLFAHRDECKGLSYNTIINAYNTNPNGNVKEHDIKLRRRREFDRYLSESTEQVHDIIHQHINKDKLIMYLVKNNINPCMYFDYLHACNWLQLNFKDTKVLFPKDFLRMHDLYVSQLYRRNNCSLLMNNVAKKYEYLEFNDEEYSLTIAKNKSELIYESKTLNHCVGTLDYDLKQAKEKSLICFVRPISDCTTPFCTVEFDLRKKKVLQCYGKNNTLLPEVYPFINKWLKHARKSMRNTNLEQVLASAA